MTFIFQLVFQLAFILAQAGTTITQPETAQLREQIRALQSDPDLKHASWGVVVMDANSGEVIASHDKDRSLIPASAQKIMTTAAALALLGEDYRYTTILEYRGTINDGVLDGDIFIRGGGDPTLGSDAMAGVPGSDAVLNRWVKAIKAAGITTVNGSVIGDASFFVDNVAPSSWTYGDMGNYYGASASALTFDDNTYWLYLQSAAGGTRTKLVNTDPEIPGIVYQNMSTAGDFGSGDNAYIHGSPLTNIYVIKGTIPPSRKVFGIKGAIPDPALYTALQLHLKLKASGVKVEKEPIAIAGTNPTQRTPLDTLTSPTLAVIAKVVNEKSNNLYAEHLLKTLGKEILGNGATEEGLKAVKEFWISQGLSLEGMDMYDGSGLSRRNIISAQHMAKALQLMKDEESFPAFYNSLSVAGKTGTLQYMLKKTPAEGNLRAKSGTLGGVKAYAGYVTTTTGRELAFALIANNYTCSSWAMTNKWERLMKSMAAM